MISGREVSAGVRKGESGRFPRILRYASEGREAPAADRQRGRGVCPGQIARWWYPSEAGRLRPALVGDRRRGRGASRGPGGSDWCPPGVDGTVAVFVGAGQVRLALFGGRYGRGVRLGSGGSGRRSMGIDGAAAASAGGGCMCFSALSVGVILLHTSFLGCSIYGTLLLSSP